MITKNTHTSEKLNLNIWEYPSVINNFSKDATTYARMVELSNINVKHEDFVTYTKECAHYIYKNMFGKKVADEQISKLKVVSSTRMGSCWGGYQAGKPYIKMCPHKKDKTNGLTQSVDVFVHEIAHALQYTLLLNSPASKLWDLTISAIAKYTGKEFTRKQLIMKGRGHNLLWTEIYRTMLAVYCQDMTLSQEALNSAPSQTKCKKIKHELIGTYRYNGNCGAWIMGEYLIYCSLNFGKRFTATKLLSSLEETIKDCEMKYKINADMLDATSFAGIKQLVHLNTK